MRARMQRFLFVELTYGLYVMRLRVVYVMLVKLEQSNFKAVDKKAEEREHSMALDEFIHDLEVHLYERNYKEFTRQMLDHKQKETQGTISATEPQQTKVRAPGPGFLSLIDALRQLLVEKLVEEFNASLQTSERMHKKENHLEFLIQLGETQLATEMCLQNYSVQIALQLRHVPSYGNALNYVINFSRTFFTSLLVCYEDYEHRYDPQHVTKYVSSALRYVFYGSRQLELAGLPTAHCLAPYLARGLVSFFTSYCISIKNTLREEIKRERWEMTTRTIRDPENKLDREIILTQSARSFYTLVQQFLRDNAALWEKLMDIGVKRCAQSLLKMSINWQDMDLADESLPDVSSSAAESSSSLFANVLVKELAGMANNQLDKATRSYCDQKEKQQTVGGEDCGNEKANATMPSLVLEALFQEMQNDESWWQRLSGKGGATGKRLGYGGVNKFLAELQVLRNTVPTNKRVEAMGSEVDKKIMMVYQQLHPEKKEVRAPAEWVQAYSRQCLQESSPSTQ
ncbi:hypothetical protein BBJ28_00018907 [Nothophytophthora sp. Chile5]|nr:hypothetical protein BBJ28_00018907 [Nothophytophthora sp. Chile5]